MQWLTGNLSSDYHSICDFRKVNPQALENTFKLFVLFLKDASLAGATTVASDGTKVRAHNSKKNNYSQKKLERHLNYIEEKSKLYLKHIFGTIKRFRFREGYDHTNLTGLKKAVGEMSLIMLVYNIKRCANIPSIPSLIA